MGVRICLCRRTQSSIKEAVARMSGRTSSYRDGLFSRLGRGINLGNLLDIRPADAPGWTLRDLHLDAIVAAGFTTVRLPVNWCAHSRAASPFAVEPGFLARVVNVIEAAAGRGLTVVMTMHHADAVYTDPLGQLNRLAALWRQIAVRFAGTPYELAFELLNEPHLPMTADHWNAVLPIILQSVREIDNERPVIVGSAEANTIAGLRHLEVPPDDHLIVTVHYYLPFRFTHQGASWEPGSRSWLGTRWGTPDDQAAVTADLEMASAWAKQRDVPLYVGEFGSYEATDQASRVRWTHWVRHELDRLGLPWAYWDFATDFGAYDVEQSAWHDDILEVLLGRA